MDSRFTKRYTVCIDASPNDCYCVHAIESPSTSSAVLGSCQPHRQNGPSVSETVRARQSVCRIYLASHLPGGFCALAHACLRLGDGQRYIVLCGLPRSVWRIVHAARVKQCFSDMRVQGNVLWNGYFDSAIVLSLRNYIWQIGIIKCVLNVLDRILLVEHCYQQRRPVTNTNSGHFVQPHRPIVTA